MGTAAEDLHLTSIRPVALAALLKSPPQDPPLSRLHTLHIHHGEHTPLFSALVGLLAERKQRNRPITKGVIKSSTVSAEDVDRLGQLRGMVGSGVSALPSSTFFIDH